MKKILSVLLLCVLLLSMTACKSKTSAATFFPDSLLQQCCLSGMPAPENSQLKANYLYCQLDENAYGAYMETLVAYLQAKTDIFYLCYLHSDGLEGDVFPYDIYTYLPEDYNYQAESHIFALSPNPELGKYDALQTPIRLVIRREEGKLEKTKFSYNTVIMLEGAPARGVRLEPCVARHTYDEGIAYPIPGTDQVSTVRHCIHCQEQTRENFLSDDIAYKITLAKGISYIAKSNRILSECVSGLEIEITVNAVENGDMVILVNGYPIPRIREGDGTWTYGFTMPQCDITIELEPVTD